LARGHRQKKGLSYSTVYNPLSNNKKQEEREDIRGEEECRGGDVVWVRENLGAKREKDI